MDRSYANRHFDQIFKLAEFVILLLEKKKIRENDLSRLLHVSLENLCAFRLSFLPFGQVVGTRAHNQANALPIDS